MKFLLSASLVLLPALALSQQVAPQSQPAIQSQPMTPHATPYVSPVLDQWRGNYGIASDDLQKWLKTDPDAAAVVAFAKRHPGRTKMLIDWSLQNFGHSASEFNEEHHQLIAQLLQNSAGADNLLAWARKHGEAALKLADSPRGFGWAVEKIFPETPAAVVAPAR